MVHTTSLGSSTFLALDKYPQDAKILAVAVAHNQVSGSKSTGEISCVTLDVDNGFPTFIELEASEIKTVFHGTFGV